MAAPRDSHPAEALVTRYLTSHGTTDLDGVIVLFSPDATLEDPVGTPILEGRTAIRAFYRESHARNGRLVFERVGPVLVGAGEIAFHVRARLEHDADSRGMDVIYTLRLDPEGRIRALRAYF